MHRFFKNIILSIALLPLSSALWAQLPFEQVVSKAIDDNTDGTFSFALQKALNDGGNSKITFNIPNATAINPPVIKTAKEYLLTECKNWSKENNTTLEIDGTSQPNSRNVIFENSGALNTGTAFIIAKSNVNIYGLHIRKFNTAILIKEDPCENIVTLQDGLPTRSLAALFSDINIGKVPSGGIDYGNILVSNAYGVRTEGDIGIIRLGIINNYIGTDKISSSNIGNTENVFIAPAISATTINLKIEGNVIAGGRYGVLTARQVSLNGNFIGTNKTQTANLKTAYGFFNYNNNIRNIIRNNVFAYNDIGINEYSIGLESQGNVFYCNGSPLVLTSPSPISTPTITSARSNLIQGTGTVGNTIELFYSNNINCNRTPAPPCQGRTIINAPRTITVAANGTWSYTPTTPLTNGANITALQHNTIIAGPLGAINRSSLFSTCATVLCPTIAATFTKKDVSCNGGADGSATITVTAAGTYTYGWKTTETASTSNIRTNLTAGNYTVTITNTTTNCPSTLAVNITQPTAALDATCAVTRQLSSAVILNDATARIIVTGGTPPYTLSVTSPNGTTINRSAQPSGIFDLIGLSAGVYTVVASDRNYTAPTNVNSQGCTQMCTFTINSFDCSSLKASLTQFTAVSCPGGSQGVMMLKYDDLLGNLPLAVRWSHNNSIDSIRTFTRDSSFNKFSLKAGQYTVTITDRARCSFETSGRITQPDSLFATCDSTSAALKIGEASGSAWIDIKGGFPNFIIRISQGPTIKPDTIVRSNGRFRISGLRKGQYLATVIFSGSDCQDICAFTIDDPTCTLRSEFDITNVSCFNGANGAALLKPDSSSGNAPFKYKWANSTLTTPNRTGLRTGDYIFTITDNQLCTYTDTVTITQPNSLLITCLPSDSTLTVGGRTGQGKFQISGGEKPYFVKTYLVSNNSLVFQSDSLYSDDAQTGRILPAGIYRTEVTDINRCPLASCNFTVFSPNCSGFSATTSTTPVKCNGDSTGTATITPSNGKSPYEYRWLNGQTTQTDLNLKAGAYPFTVTDARLCPFSGSATIAQLPALTATYTKISDVTTNGGKEGSFSITVQGGTLDYTVNIKRTQSTILIEPTRKTGNTFVFENLENGTYTGIVTDANNCAATEGSMTINGISCALRITAIPTNVRCNGDGTGKINTTVTNNNGTVNYSWTGPTAIGNIPNPIDLRSGSYRVIATDVRGCQDNATVTVTEPAKLASRNTPIDTKGIGQNNGEIRLKIIGGMSTYVVSLSLGTGIVSPILGASDSFHIKDLVKGSYRYVIADANGCKDSATVTINDPGCNNLAINNALVENPKCFGDNKGRIAITVTGGTRPYKYAWSPNPSADSIASNLTAGSYTVIVNDIANCPANRTFDLTQPSAINAADSIRNIQVVGKNDGRNRITISGGKQPYTVTRVGGITASQLNDTTFVFDSLPQGKYDYQITDVNGCSKTASFTINSPECSAFIVTALPTNPRCTGENNGRIDITVTGETGLLSYRWADDITRNSPIADKLSGGNYSVTVTDGAGCEKSISTTITPPLPLKVETVVTQLVKIGENTGGIVLNISGGTPNYTVVISGQIATGTPPQYIYANLGKGTYKYTVTDSKSCPLSDSVVIRDPSCNNLSINNVKIDSLKCFDTKNASITVTATGGTRPYKYAWNLSSSTDSIARDLAPNIYTVIVTDNANCTTTRQTINITSPSAITVKDSIRNVQIVGKNDGRNRITISGGKQPYTVTRVGSVTANRLNDTTFVFDNLTSGGYTYEIRDDNGCLKTSTFNIGDPDCAISNQIQLSASKPISCAGAADGAITLTLQNGQTPQYSWSGGLGTVQNPTNVKAGTYTVTITDGRGCTATKEITLTDPPQIKATIYGDTAICAGQSSPLRFTVTGATVFYLVFTNGSSNTTISTTETLVNPTANTTFNLVRVQAGVCTGVVSGSARVQVTTLPSPTGLVVNTTNDSLCAGSNLSLNLTPSVLQGVQYLWQTPTGAVTTPVPNLTIPNTTNIHSGSYTVRLSQNGCLSAISTPLPVTVVFVTPEKAFAGVDKTECGNTNTTLAADAPLGRNIVGKWQSLDGATVLQANSNTPSVSGLKLGINRFVWVISNNACGEMDRDMVIVSVALKPVLTEQQYSLEGTASSILINLKELIKDTSKLNISLTSPVIGADLLPNKQFIVFDRSNNIDAKTAEIPFKVCPAICPNLCETSRVFIKMAALTLNTDTLIVPHIFGSGASTGAYMQIENIERFENNECLIVDRWGTPVFGPLPYKNDQPDNAWNATKDGKPLPSGAYYWFIWDKSKSVKRPLKGVIYLIDGR
jgi:hypothetical protein